MKDIPRLSPLSGNLIVSMLIIFKNDVLISGKKNPLIKVAAIVSAVKLKPFHGYKTRNNLKIKLRKINYRQMNAIDPYRCFKTVSSLIIH